MAQEAIDKKYLARLKYKSSEKNEKGSGHTPTKRPLTPENVLDWKDNGTTVTIITADGQKYLVNKIAKPAKDGEDKE